MYLFSRSLGLPNRSTEILLSFRLLSLLNFITSQYAKRAPESHWRGKKEITSDDKATYCISAGSINIFQEMRKRSNEEEDSWFFNQKEKRESIRILLGAVRSISIAVMFLRRSISGNICANDWIIWEDGSTLECFVLDAERNNIFFLSFR